MNWSDAIEFLKVSASGAALVMVGALLRAGCGRRLPRGAFVALWWVALARFLLPFSLPSRFNLYGLLRRETGDMMRPVTFHAGGGVPFWEPVMQGRPDAVARDAAFSILPTLWLLGFAACATVFLIAALRSRRILRAARSVTDAWTLAWQRTHPLRRPLRIMETSCPGAPLTCGVLRPAIYLPAGIAGEDETRLRYVLEHEYVHVRRFDALCKQLLSLSVCVHWFNPFAWLLLALANRDLELACDAQVVRRLGGNAAYARALLSLEARKSGWLPLSSHLNKNAIEERIVSIMKWKPSSKAAAVLAAAVVVVVTAAFATSPARRTETVPPPTTEAAPAAENPTVRQPQEPKTLIVSQIQKMYGVDVSQLSCEEETFGEGCELTFGDIERDAWYYKAGVQPGSTAFTFVGRYHGKTAEAVSGPLEDPAFRAEAPAIREACESVLREIVGVDAGVTRARVYANAASDVRYADMVGIEFSLDDGRYCTVTLQYPALTPRSYQLLSVSSLDAGAERGHATQVLYDTEA